MQFPLHRDAAEATVRDLQRRLHAAGHGAADDAPGRYGPGTEAAVAAFQQAAGLDVDGRCTEVTWNALVEAGYELGDRQLYFRAPMMRGDDVFVLQRSLGALGFDAGRLDGVFGPDTARALGDFQRNCGLPGDGIFGPESLSALERLGPSRTDALGVAHVREQEWLRRLAAADIAARRLVIGEPGGLAALASATTRALRDAGAIAVSLDHPDWSEQARQANALAADVFVGLRLQGGAGVTVAYFATAGYESAGGRHLAELMVEEVATVPGPGGEHAITGMRLPLLRETRMPAVLVALGPAGRVVEHTALVAGALSRALARWIQGSGAPVGPESSTRSGSARSASASTSA